MAVAAASGVSYKTNKTVALSGEGDQFELSDTYFNSSESFVYTAVANFESGQACGLVFGGADQQVYWVFNVDRIDNRTKLMRFGKTDPYNYAVEVIEEEPFIGNKKTTASEYNVIRTELETRPQYSFKVVITVENNVAYGEFFIDNIRRFAFDDYGNDRDPINLNAVITDVTYNGGYLGFNTYNASVNFTDINIGKNDYAYYTEMYRNQYHYSQYAHWNNDPNGLVYYNGWYHMYYQTHPFNQDWGAMYWGHARSRDLIHWEELPIALFPDDGTMGKGLGTGYAWSGIAMVYHPGMSDEIDGRNWFPNGGGTGLLGYYTRDGEKQDQVIISSDDGGITWTKQELISQHLIENSRKIDCRDPSLFPVKKDGSGHVTLWGMVISGANENKYWFLKSEDMVNWSYAGTQEYIYPECMTVSKVAADDSTDQYVITVSSRHYTVGHFEYDEVEGIISFVLPDGRNIKNVPQNEAFRPMDYGEDSYAAQTFYIDDNNSEYYGKAISINWYSGLPSDAESDAYKYVRKPWNGGGMTIPVELGLKKVGDDYNLTQTPITLSNNDLERESTPLVDISEDLVYDNTNDPLSTVNSHLIELEANIKNDDENSVEFKVNLSSNEYTSFGWTKSEGYFFDRTHTSKAGIYFKKHYAHRFTTGPVDGKNLSFYVLVDNGGLELFCGEYQYSFYNLTLASPYSLRASLTTSGEVTIETLKVQQIKSIWHEKSELDKGVLYLESDDVELDLTLGQSKEVMAYSSNDSDINWTIKDGEEHISLTETIVGAKITAVSNGTATVEVTSGDTVKTINVIVDDAEVNCDFELKASNVYSGNWLTTSNGLVGKQNIGDGFIISDKDGGDFTYTATFDISHADAAGLLLRASKDMSSYIMVNYDKVGNVCKMWSPNGEIARTSVNGVDPANFSLSVKTTDNYIDLYLNGTLVLSGKAKASDSLTGYYGLNVCSGKAVINDIRVIKSEYDFNNEDLVISSGSEQYIKAIYNFTNKNTLVDSSYYHTDGENIVIHKEYFELLEGGKTYSFFIEGDKVSFGVKVIVGDVDKVLSFEDRSIKVGEALNIYMAAFELESLLINDKAVSEDDYELRGDVLHIYGSYFSVGTYTVTVNGKSFNVEVTDILEAVPTSIEVTQMPNKTEYEVGEELELEGLIISLNYSDDTVIEVDFYEVDGFDSSTPGTTTVTVSFDEFTTTFDLTIKETVLTSISVTALPTKTEYEVGEELELDGLEVTGNYSNSTTGLLTDYTVSGFDSSVSGTTTVTVTYGEFTTTFDLTIKPKVLTKIEITAMPTKTEYEVGEFVDLDGLILTATYSNGDTEEVEDYNISGFDSSTPGKKTLTITYGDYSVEIELKVKHIMLTGIKLTHRPTKLNYTQGEELDLTGLVITAIYSNGTTAQITDYVVIGYDANTTGKQTIKVIYGGHSVEFEVAVKAAAKPKKKGCGGSVAASLGILSIASFAAFGLLTYKKRKEG